MFIVVGETEKEVQIIDVSDGVVESIAKAKAVFFAKQLNIFGIDSNGIHVTSIEKLIKQFLQQGDITSALTITPEGWDIEVSVEKRNGDFLEFHTFQIYWNSYKKANAGKSWARMKDNRSKSFSSGYTDAEMINYLCDIYRWYGGFKSVSITSDNR